MTFFEEFVLEELHYQRKLLEELFKLVGKEERQIRKIEHKLPKLSFIRIAIGGIMPVGPATLTVGDTKTATVLGFDQNGAPFAIDFSANPITWADDNEASVQDSAGSTAGATSDTLTALAVGVMNLTATCAGFTDTETVTVVAQAPKLAAIKVSID